MCREQGVERWMDRKGERVVKKYCREMEGEREKRGRGVELYCIEIEGAV